MKNIKWTALLACFLAALAVLTSCGAPTLRYNEDEQGYVKSDGTVFCRANKNYAAVGIEKEEPIAEIRQDGDDLPLYRVCGKNETMNADLWMASADYTLYYAKGTALPKLWEMQVSEVRILQNTAAAFVMAYITDAGEINTLIDTYQNGKSFSHKVIQSALAISTHTQYNLVCASQNYDGIYYMLVYYRFDDDVIVTDEQVGVTGAASFVPTYDVPYTLTEGEDGALIVKYNFGKNIVFDRVSGQCYAVSGVFDSHFDRES